MIGPNQTTEPAEPPLSEEELPEATGLPERARARREQLGLSIRGLAKQLRISHATIVRIENGVSISPRMDVLLALAKGLRVNVLWLMAGSENQESSP